MLLIVKIEDKNKKCKSCSNKGKLIEIRAVDEKYNIYDSLILCESCKKNLVNRLEF